MATVITNGGSGATGSHSMTGDTSLIFSGNFGSGAIVVIEKSADSQDKAVIAKVKQPGSFLVAGASGETLDFTVKGGNASTSIDVTAN